MRRSTASELRMLREIVWHIGIAKRCFFCKEPLLAPDGPLEFGERNLPPVKTKIAVHHRDGNHENNADENRKLAHSKCHRRYHIKLQHAKAGGKRIGAQ